MSSSNPESLGLSKYPRLSTDSTHSGDLDPTGNPSPSAANLSTTSSEAPGDDSSIGQFSDVEEPDMQFTDNSDALKKLPSSESLHLFDTQRDEGGDESEGGASPPDTFSAYLHAGILSSPGASSAASVNSTASSQKVHVLIYDASIWGHEQITLLDGTSINVTAGDHTMPHTIQPCGVLGVHSSEAKAKRVGKAWLYSQLMALGVPVDMPLPYQDAVEYPDVYWKKTGWKRTADGSLGYSISDYSPKMAALSVYVSERVVDGSYDEEGDQDSSDEEGNQRYVLVGPLGRRNRVLA